MSDEHDTNKKIGIDGEHSAIAHAVETFLFRTKWFLIFFYVGLSVVLLLYGVTFVRELVELAFNFNSFKVEQMKIAVLDLIDIVMIANLTKMIITGSYNSFVSKLHGRINERISSGMLKVKIMTSVIVVATIGLLRNFVSDTASMETIEKGVMVYAAFLCGALVLGLLDFMHIKGEQIEQSLHHE